MQSQQALTASPAFWGALILLLPILLTLSALQIRDHWPREGTFAARLAALSARAGAWLRRHYVAIVLVLAAALALAAFFAYLINIARSVHDMTALLQTEARALRTTGPLTTERTSSLRDIAQGSALLLGVLAAAATIFFSVIRVWINERNARATEDGLITDRINKAVAGLGTEKTVKRQRVNDKGEAIHVHDDHGTPDLTKPVYEERTEPNLEVRIGAILSLERIAQDSARDHIQIMEILCAYIRQNIADRRIPALPDDYGPDLLQGWGFEGHEDLRHDIDLALKVIERRDPRRRAEETQGEAPYRLGLRRLAATRLDLSRRDLRGADLTGAELQGAYLAGAKLQGAFLSDADLQGANLLGVQLQRANLTRADLQGAFLSDAELQDANLSGALLNWASLTDAKLQGANLRGAELSRAGLSGAQLQGAQLQSAAFWGTELRAADLGRSNLLGANLGHANLQRADLKGADIRSAEFDAATDLSSATLRGALLSDVDFTNVDKFPVHLDPTQVFFDGSITLPGGITSDMPEWPYEDRREVLEYDPHDPESSPLFRAWRAWQRQHHPDTLPDHLR